jgi:hypothetical protein
MGGLAAVAAAAILLLELSPLHCSASCYDMAISAHIHQRLKAASISTAPASVFESPTCCYVSVSDIYPCPCLLLCG